MTPPDTTRHDTTYDLLVLHNEETRFQPECGHDGHHQIDDIWNLSIDLWPRHGASRQNFQVQKPVTYKETLLAQLCLLLLLLLRFFWNQ